MYKDIITGLKIPTIYALMNGKNELFYNNILNSILTILTQSNQYKLKFDTIVTDSEQALVNVIQEKFPNSQRISCLFHYKMDILRNLRSYGLYKAEYKNNSNIILEELSKLPIYYKGDMNYLIKK